MLAALAALLTIVSANGTSSDAVDRLAWWREARFGLFIHWGLYSIPAGEWNGQNNHAEWIRDTAQIPLDVYERFVTQFHPVHFDADAWVRAAKAAGMKYIIITTKHHDGFCLFDSKYTDFDILSTPFRRDIMKELADACRRHGLKIGWYYSIMDWRHPDYLPRRGWEAKSRSADGANFDRYFQYVKNQVTELLTNYGEIGVMWFDGEWESTWTKEYGAELYRLCRRLQPNVIVNNRVSPSRSGMESVGATGKELGDFGTPEQYIPATGLPGVDWETCMTMNDHWGFNRHDQNWKSSAELIRNLVDIVSKGGNYLLNIGPTALGEFPSESLERLREIGRWMERNGEAIYGTSASPFQRLPWGRCTVRPGEDASTLYLHVFEGDQPTGILRVPGIDNEPLGAKLLATREPLEVFRSGADIAVRLPDKRLEAPVAVIQLAVRGRPIVHNAPAIEAPSDIFVRPISVSLSAPEGVEIRYTTDGSSPNAQSTLYRNAFQISDTTVIRAVAVKNGRVVSPMAERQISRVAPRPADTVRNLASGLLVSVYRGEWERMPDFSKLRSESTTVVPEVTLGHHAEEERVGLVFEGVLMIPEDDVYVFSLTSDDGARFWIGDRLVLDNDGLHVAQTVTAPIALARGPHRIRVEWFNRTGDTALSLALAHLGGTPSRISRDVLFHETEED
jgi:alpha-L-fucosidase